MSESACPQKDDPEFEFFKSPNDSKFAAELDWNCKIS